MIRLARAAFIDLVFLFYIFIGVKMSALERTQTLSVLCQRGDHLKIVSMIKNCYSKGSDRQDVED